MHFNARTWGLAGQVPSVAMKLSFARNQRHLVTVISGKTLEKANTKGTALVPRGDKVRERSNVFPFMEKKKVQV